MVWSSTNQIMCSKIHDAVINLSTVSRRSLFSLPLSPLPLSHILTCSSFTCFLRYYIEMLSHAIYIIGAGVLCASLICLPPWPMFQQRPLQWLKRSDYKVETVRFSSTPRLAQELPHLSCVLGCVHAPGNVITSLNDC